MDSAGPLMDPSVALMKHFQYIFRVLKGSFSISAVLFFKCPQIQGLRWPSKNPYVAAPTVSFNDCVLTEGTLSFSVFRIFSRGWKVFFQYHLGFSTQSFDSKSQLDVCHLHWLAVPRIMIHDRVYWFSSLLLFRRDVLKQSLTRSSRYLDFIVDATIS